MYNTIDSFDGEYRFLSNFYVKDFKWSTQWIWKSAEHAYQAAKCEPSNALAFLEIHQASTPGKAKRLGKKVKLRSEWDAIKLDIMYSILMSKFSDKELQEKLLATGNMELIEGNDWGDEFWGVCDRKGLNHLGRLLMKVRNEYRAQKCILGNI